MSTVRRIAFVTIGHSPRPDIVPEMVAEMLGDRSTETVEIGEFGILDGLGGADLKAMLAIAGEPQFATRDADGNEISVSVEKTERRLNDLLAHVDTLNFDMIILLCTGTRIVPPEKTLVIEAQRVVDGMIDILGTGRTTIGILMPYESQASSVFGRHGALQNISFAAASPYDGAPLAQRAAPLTGCAVTVMHCMGYSRAMRDELQAALPNHVLHARGMVASFVRQFL